MTSANLHSSLLAVYMLPFTAVTFQNSKYFTCEYIILLFLSSDN